MDRSREGWDFRHESDALIFAAAECFLKAIGIRYQRNKGTISHHIPTEHGSPTEAVIAFLKTQNKEISRQQVYPTLWEAFRRELIVLRPPLEQTLAENLYYKYGFDHRMEGEKV